MTPLAGRAVTQGTDPATDFRGAGFLSLECQLYMADCHPVLFDALRHKRAGSRSEWEYPFAAAGVNLCFTLLGAPPRAILARAGVRSRRDSLASPLHRPLVRSL